MDLNKKLSDKELDFIEEKLIIEDYFYKVTENADWGVELPAEVSPESSIPTWRLSQGRAEFSFWINRSFRATILA